MEYMQWVMEMMKELGGCLEQYIPDICNFSRIYKSYHKLISDTS